MNTCRDWKDHLVDCALDAPASPELEAHLQKCSACAAALAELRARREQMDRLLPTLVRGAEPSAGFGARLLAALEQPPAPRQGSPLRARILAGATAAVLVAAVLFVSSERWRARRAGPEAPASSRADLTAWRSPTDGLLRSPSDEFLKSSPRLAEFYFPLPFAPPGAGTKRSQWRKP